jgi:hypothetical protein
MSFAERSNNHRRYLWLLLCQDKSKRNSFWESKCRSIHHSFQAKKKALPKEELFST